MRLTHDWVQQTEYRTKYLLFYWLHSPTTRCFALKFCVNFSHPGCFWCITQFSAIIQLVMAFMRLAFLVTNEPVPKLSPMLQPFLWLSRISSHTFRFDGVFLLSTIALYCVWQPLTTSYMIETWEIKGIYMSCCSPCCLKLEGHYNI